jgi:hypothetical protein
MTLSTDDIDSYVPGRGERRWFNLNALLKLLRADYLSGAVTWDPGSLADGAGETSAGITVTGAELGDFVSVAAPYDLQDATVTGYVSAADTVEIRIQNESGGVRDFAEGSWKVRVYKD